LSGLATRLPADDADSGTVSDDVLLGRLATGEQDALSELFDRYQAQMYGLAMRITNDPSMAQDAVQEAFVGVWRNAARYSAARASVRTWILSITHHRAIDLVRRRRSNARLPDTDAAQDALTVPDVWPEVARASDAAAVRSALTRLPVDQRTSIELAYFEGLTQAEIATRVGAPVGTIKSRVRLGLRQLRRYLEATE
jgi:RNA polymerase sigma-70 factor (ECF subfamily)